MAEFYSDGCHSDDAKLDREELSSSPGLLYVRRPRIALVSQAPRRKKTKQPDATERGIATKRMKSTRQLHVIVRGNETQLPQRGRETQTSDAEDYADVPEDARRHEHVAARGSKHAAAHEEKATDRRKRMRHRVEGLSTVVKMFAGGWFPSKEYHLLYSAATECDMKCVMEVLRSIESFKTGFLRIGGKPDGDWNSQLKDTLFQLRQVRREYADEFSEMSEEETSACLWHFAREFIFNGVQLNMSRRKQRSVLQAAIQRNLGSQNRLRAVIRTGLQPFVNCEDKYDLLKRLLLYMDRIESIAGCYKAEGCYKEESEQKQRPRTLRTLRTPGEKNSPRSAAAAGPMPRPYTPPRWLKQQSTGTHLDGERRDFYQKSASNNCYLRCDYVVVCYSVCFVML